MSSRLISKTVAAICCSFLIGAMLCAEPPVQSSPSQPAILESPADGPATQPLTAVELIAEEVRSVFNSCRKAVVRVEASDSHGTLSGTGFFIDPNGTLYTSYTVGGESRDIVVCLGTARYSAYRIVADSRSGIAILKVDAETPFLLPAQSRSVQIASPVVAIGYPLDLPSTPSFATIGGFDIKYLGRVFATTHIRTNMPIQRGEGGSPLLNMHGEVIGILISSRDSGSPSFALPIDAAEKLHRDFIRFGRIRPGWMGISVVAFDEPVKGSHAQVDAVLEGGPAQKAGLQKGDVILQIDRQKIASIEDVIDASFFMTVEDQLNIRIIRGEQEMELTLQPADHPASLHAPYPHLEWTLPAPNPPGLREEYIPFKIDR